LALPRTLPIISTPLLPRPGYPLPGDTSRWVPKTRCSRAFPSPPLSGWLEPPPCYSTSRSQLLQPAARSTRPPARFYYLPSILCRRLNLTFLYAWPRLFFVSAFLGSPKNNPVLTVPLFFPIVGARQEYHFTPAGGIKIFYQFSQYSFSVRYPCLPRPCPTLFLLPQAPSREATIRSY